MGGKIKGRGFSTSGRSRAEVLCLSALAALASCCQRHFRNSNNTCSRSRSLLLGFGPVTFESVSSSRLDTLTGGIFSSPLNAGSTSVQS